MKLIKSIIFISTIILLHSCNESDNNLLSGLFSKKTDTITVSTSDSTFTGEQKIFARKNVLKSTVNYLNGKKHGVTKTFYPDGKVVMFKITYKNGIKDGETIKYYKSGKVYKRTNYADGKITGDVIKYYEGGKKQAIISYENGKQNGVLKEYDNSGKLVTYLPKMHFKVIDNGSMSGLYVLEISIDKYNKYTRYFVNNYPTGFSLFNGQINPNHTLSQFITEDLLHKPLEFEKGKGYLKINAPEGYYLMKKFDFIACYKTRLGNYTFIKDSYFLSIEN